MSILASLAGSGAGLIAIAVAILVDRHYRNFPGVLHSWIERAMIVLMYAGGSAIAVTQLGQWARDAALWATGLFGGVGSGLAHVALVISALFMVAALIVALIWAPTSVTATTAALMPLILSLTGAGFLHEFYMTTSAPAQALASSLASWIGG